MSDKPATWSPTTIHLTDGNKEAAIACAEKEGVFYNLDGLTMTVYDSYYWARLILNACTAAIDS